LVLLTLSGNSVATYLVRQQAKKAMNDEKDDSRRKFASELREERLRRGLTQAQFGELLGVSGGIIGNWELARAVPHPRNVRILRERLGEDFTRRALNEAGPANANAPPGAVGIADPISSVAANRVRSYLESIIAAVGDDEALLGWLLVEMRSRFGQLIGAQPRFDLNDQPSISGAQMAEAVLRMARAESVRTHAADPPTPEAPGPPPPAHPDSTEGQPPKNRATPPHVSSLKS
jgi:transcriptional regulator with XRE-family HTH domain